MGCMRRAGFAILSMFKTINVYWLWIWGYTPESASAERVVNGKVWEEFCDSIKAAGASMLAGDPPVDGFNQAEGYRYLTRLLRVALENFVECADPAAPVLVALANGSRAAPVKIGSDNPDNLYQSAIISSEYVYCVEGTRGSVHYLGLGLQSGTYGKPGGLLTIDYKEASDMGFPKDLKNTSLPMKFFISTKSKMPKCCSRRKSPVPWLCMADSPVEHVLIVRQTYEDRLTEEAAELKISCDGGNVPSNITPKKLEESLQTASLFVAGASMMFSMWAKDFKAHTNKLPLFDQEKSNRAGGDPNLRYYHSYWALADDEALVIEAMPPKCDSWNFQLNNHWMESLEYRYFTVHVNAHLATYNDDGSVIVVVSHNDPGLPHVNWIDTVGHTCGTMCWRWIRPESDPCPAPRPRVVKLSAFLQEENGKKKNN